MAAKRAVVLLLALPVTAAAQESILLRYQPGPGGRVQTVSETRIEAVVGGLPSLPDSSVIEGIWRTVVTRRVLEVSGGARKVSVSLDSSRARAKAGEGGRNDVALAGVPGLSARYQVGERLQSSDVAPMSDADSGIVAVLLASFGGFEFSLPEAALPVRGTWTSALRFPLGVHLSVTGKVTGSGTAAGSGTATLDSLVPRGADTLAFLTLHAVLGPATLGVAAEGGTGTGQFSGRFAAALVWSTGWNAVVSAVSNGRLEGRIRVEGA